MSGDLLPCPFCGATEPDTHFSHLSGGIFCENCGAEGPWSPAFDGDWNTRTAVDVSGTPIDSHQRPLPSSGAQQNPAMEAEPVAWMPCPLCGEDLNSTDGPDMVHDPSDTCPLDQLYLQPRHRAAWNRRAHPQDAESLRGEVERLKAESDRRLCDLHIIGARAEKAEAERDAALARVAEVDLIAEMLDAGQGDDDGAQILPNFEDGMTLAGKVEACLHLLERRRDVIDAYQSADADPPCTDCGGTGITYQTERRCACQGPAALTPPPDAGLDDLIDRLEAGVASCGLHEDNETELFFVEDANDTMAEAATALRARPVGEVKVKPLVWEDGHSGPLEFPSSYHIDGNTEDGFRVSLSWRTCNETLSGPEGDLVFSSVAEAEAAVQADLTARIRAALEGGEG